MTSPRTRCSIVIGAICALALGGCDSSNGPDLTGSWSGVGQCLFVSATLTENSGGTITGSATVGVPVSCGFAAPPINHRVSGEHNHPGLVLTLVPVPGQGPTASRSFSGDVSGADSIEGTLDGTSVTLTRQP